MNNQKFKFIILFRSIDNEDFKIVIKILLDFQIGIMFFLMFDDRKNFSQVMLVNQIKSLFLKLEKIRLRGLTLRSIWKKVPPRHDSLSGGYFLSVVYRKFLWYQPSIFLLWSSWRVIFSKTKFPILEILSLILEKNFWKARLIKPRDTTSW